MKFMSAMLVFLAASASAGAAPRVQGHIQLVDEENRPWAHFLLNTFVEVSFAYQLENTEVLCPGRGVVSTETWSFEYVIHESCFGRDLAAQVSIYPLFDWTPVPPPRLVQWEEDKELYQLEVPIRRPRELMKTVRQELFRKGKKLLAEKSGESVAYFAEAARGSDLDFTVAAVNYLEANDSQALAFKVLAQKDISMLHVGDRTKFLLAMRRGNAARAAGLVDQAFESYELAQQIYPRSDEPVGFAYTVALQSSGAKNSRQLIERLSANPELEKNLSSVLGEWKAPISVSGAGSLRDSSALIGLAAGRAELLANPVSVE